MKTRVQPRHFSTFDPERPKQRLPRALLLFQCSELERIVKIFDGQRCPLRITDLEKMRLLMRHVKRPLKHPCLVYAVFTGFLILSGKGES